MYEIQWGIKGQTTLRQTSPDWLKITSPNDYKITHSSWLFCTKFANFVIFEVKDYKKSLIYHKMTLHEMAVPWLYMKYWNLIQLYEIWHFVNWLLVWWRLRRTVIWFSVGDRGSPIIFSLFIVIFVFLRKGLVRKYNYHYDKLYKLSLVFWLFLVLIFNLWLIGPCPVSEI